MVTSRDDFLLRHFESKRCVCGNLLGPRVDGARKKIDGRDVCDDCYFKAIGALVEQHPIHTPGRHGPGGQTDLE